MHSFREVAYKYEEQPFHTHTHPSKLQRLRNFVLATHTWTVQMKWRSTFPPGLNPGVSLFSEKAGGFGWKDVENPIISMQHAGLRCAPGKCSEIFIFSSTSLGSYRGFSFCEQDEPMCLGALRPVLLGWLSRGFL